MGSYQHMQTTTGLAPFLTVCKTAGLVDYTHYCKEGLFQIIDVRLTRRWMPDHYDVLYDRGHTSVDYRTPMALEEGYDPDDPGNCSYSVIDITDAKTCKMALPKPEVIRVGTPVLDEEEWISKFCSDFPNMRAERSPFIRTGAFLLLREDEFDDRILYFASWVMDILMAGLMKHLLGTVLYGDKRRPDQFDGLFTLVENGLQSVDGHECPIPTKPPVIDFGYLVTGIPGACVHPASRIPATVAPIKLFENTVMETTFPVGGKDLLDIFYSWQKLVNEKWEWQSGAWKIFVGDEQAECVTRLAGCKQFCTDASCAPMFMNPPESVILRAADYIRNEYIQLWPDDTKIQFLKSRALQDRNEYWFMPETIQDGRNGQIVNFTLVFVDKREENEELYREIGFRPVNERYAYGLPAISDPRGLIQHYPEIEELMNRFPDSVWERVDVAGGGNKPFCWGAAFAGKGAMVMERPEVILRIKGVCCQEEPYTVCQEPDLGAWALATDSCTDIAAPVGFVSGIQINVGDVILPFLAGDAINYNTFGGTFTGTVVSYNPVTRVMVIGFQEEVDCDSGGGPDSISYGNSNPSCVVREYHITSCSGSGATVTITYESTTDPLIMPAIGATSPATVISPLEGTIVHGNVTAASGSGTTVTVEVSNVSPLAPACDAWDVPTTGDPLPLTSGGKIRFRTCPA